MAIPWMVALKVIPWGDVIEHAPKVLNAARKLMDRQKTVPPAASPASDSLEMGSEPPSLGELKNRLVEARQMIDQQAAVQQQMAQTLAELAEQNARLVSAVELLRVRTRLLLWAVALLAIGVVWLFAR